MSRHPLGLNDITVMAPPTQTPDSAYKTYHNPFGRVMEYVHHSKVPGDVLEFGTFHGYTARTFAEHMFTLKSDKHLHLYDSWEGFPDMIGGDAECPEVKNLMWKKGDCNPMILDADKAIEYFLNVIIPGKVHTHKGFYENTLPAALPKKAAVVHIDCDLYESTFFVLKCLLDHKILQDGAVIIFDDWNNNLASWKFGERRAVRELFPYHHEGMYWTERKVPIEPITGYLQGALRDGTCCIEPWFTYGSSGIAFHVHIQP